MALMILYSEAIPDQLGDSAHCPQIALIAGGDGARQQELLQLLPLRGGQARLGTRRCPAGQTRLALFLPGLIPAVGTAGSHPQSSRHLGLRDPCCEEPRRLQPPLFQGSQIAPRLAAIGRHTVLLLRRRSPFLL